MIEELDPKELKDFLRSERLSLQFACAFLISYLSPSCRYRCIYVNMLLLEDLGFCTQMGAIFSSSHFLQLYPESAQRK